MERRGLLDTTGAHLHLAGASRRKRRIMRDQHQGHAALARLGEEEVGDLALA